MKRLLSSIFTSMVILTSCIKEVPSFNGNGNEIDGKWLWEKSVGGIAGITITPRAGSNIFLEFINDSTYSLSDNNTLIIKDKYSVDLGSDMETGAEAKLISFYNSTNTPIPVMGSTNSPLVLNLSKTLKLKENVIDGYTHFFTRIIDSSK